MLEVGGGTSIGVGPTPKRKFRAQIYVCAILFNLTGGGPGGNSLFVKLQHSFIDRYMPQISEVVCHNTLCPLMFPLKDCNILK